MKTQTIPKSWGFERIIHNSTYCMKLLVYERTIASSLHYHMGKHETFYVASGVFELEVNDNPKVTLRPGMSVSLVQGTRHRLRCLEPGIIVEASSHDDPEDCVRLEPSET